MPLRDYYTGKLHKVVTYTTPDGRDQVDDYLEGLKRTRREDHTKLAALLARAANNGPPFQVKDRCRTLTGYRFYEFKTHGHRIFWFWHDRQRLIVLMHAFAKQQDQTPRQELERAAALHARIQEELERGTPRG